MWKLFGSLLFLSCLSTSKVLLAETIVLNHDMKGVVVTPSMKFLEDASRELAASAIVKMDPGSFQPSPQQNPNFGFTRSAYWTRFQLQNPDNTNQSVFLEYGYANADYIDFYQENESGELVWKRSGDQMALASRDVHYRLPVFTLNVPPGTHTYFMRIETEGVVQFPLRLWSIENFHGKRASESAFLGTIYGFFLVMAFYNLLLGISVRSPSSLLYVGFILASAGNFFGYQGLWLVFFPDKIAPWLANQGFIICSGFMASFACAFTYSFLNLQTHPRILRWLIITSGVVGLVVVILAPISYNLSAKISTANGFIAAIAILAASSVACYRGFRPAYFFSVAWLLSLAGNLATPLALAGLIPINIFTLWGPFLGVAAEVVLISLALGDKLRLAQEDSEQKIRELNTGLELKVEEKTRDIKAIMQNIKLGIFAIEADKFSIHKDYSQHLEKIFHQTRLQNRPALPLLFQNSSLTEDEKQQIQSTLEASLGEDEIAFAVNDHCLPREIHLKTQNQDQILELDWSPMINSAGQVERILVTCKDATEMRRYQKEAQSQAKELNYIAELINFSQEKFSKFSASAHHFIEENKRLLRVSVEPNREVLKILFINMHTLKGASRSLNLKELTAIVHSAENTLSQLQKGEIVWNKEQMLSEIQAVEASLAQYDWISTNRLNRSLHMLNSVEVRIEDLEKEVQAIEDLQRSPDPLIVSSYLLQMKHRMARYAFRSATEVFKELFDPAPRLAKDLDKLAPNLTLEGTGIVFTHRAVELMRNVFVHILRNSLDHGIESPSERQSAGKDPHGKIAIVLKEEPDRKLLVRISDDGRGLALGMIRQIALIKGFINRESLVNPSVLAQFIFESGFSTSAGISDISGRGVGMDAIKRWLENEGASVAIELDSTVNPSQVDFVKFSLIMRLPPSLYRVIEGQQGLALAG